MMSAQQTFKGTLAAFALGVTMVSQALAVDIQHYQGISSFKETPKRVVVLGMGALDIVDQLGVQPVGAPHELLPSYLKQYEKTTAATGSVKEPNFEAIYILKPDVIVAETRMLALYDQLNQIAPTVMLNPQDANFWKDTQSNWRMMGELFGKQKQVEKTIAKTGKQIEQINKTVKDKNMNALMLMSNGGNLAVYNKQSRFSMLFDEFGFKEVTTDEKLTGAHGNLVSYEYIADAKPDVIFVLDRDQAVGSKKSYAKDKLDNPLVAQTPASKNGKIIFVDSNAWYVTSTGMTGTKVILSDVQKALK